MPGKNLTRLPSRGRFLARSLARVNALTRVRGFARARACGLAREQSEPSDHVVANLEHQSVNMSEVVCCVWNVYHGVGKSIIEHIVNDHTIDEKSLDELVEFIPPRGRQPRGVR